jgi:hypothetical protein
MLRTLRSSPALLVAAIVLVAATAGTATAATKVLIKSSAQVKNGSLEAADLSAKARKALAGKAGPAGATGVAGPAGPAGARGPSEAFAARAGSINTPSCPVGGCAPGATLRTLTLPAGSYLVTSSAELAPRTFVANVSHSLECHLTSGDTDEFQRALHLYKAAASGGGLTHDQTVDITWALTLPAPTTMSLSCFVGDVPFTAGNARITALQVGSLTEAVS